MSNCLESNYYISLVIYMPVSVTFSPEIGCAFRCLLKMFGVCFSHVSLVNYGFPENEPFVEKLIKLQQFCAARTKMQFYL